MYFYLLSCVVFPSGAPSACFAGFVWTAVSGLFRVLPLSEWVDCMVWVVGAVLPPHLLSYLLPIPPSFKRISGFLFEARGGRASPARCLGLRPLLADRQC